MMMKKVRRANAHPLNVMATKDRIRTWRTKARTSGMTLREWVTRTLDSAPILRVDVKQVDEAKDAKDAR